MIQKWHAVVKFATVLVLFTAIGLTGGRASAEMGELETFIRVRIEIGESMMNYMRELSSGEDYNPEMGRPSMEQMRKMEEEINAMVAGILKSYDLTIEEYEQRSPMVFSDKAAVDAFLLAHPDLKKRYEVLPLHRSRPHGGPS
jgi:hypothetical protein